MAAETLGCGEADMSPPSPARSAEWQIDLEAAAATGVPVLFAADETESEALAHALSRMSSPHPRVTILHCGRGAATDVIRSLSRSNRRRESELVLFQEVQRLSAADQLLLEQQLETALLEEDTGPQVCVLASCSVPLFHRVTRGEFRERLFYLLNMIQIEVPPGSYSA